MGDTEKDRTPSFPAGSLTVHAEDRPDAVVLVVVGEVDTLTAPQLRAVVDDAVARLDDRPLVLDLTGVTFFGSSGLQILALTANRVREPDGSSGLRVAAAYATLRPIQLTGLDAVLRLYDTAEAALAG
jgi:anti-sigma B factor antagonist